MKTQQMQTGPWNLWSSYHCRKDEPSRWGTPGQSCCSHSALSGSFHKQISAKCNHSTRATIFKSSVTCVWRTTLGLKGGSTSLISNACQLMLLKKGCNRILPTIPILRVGSLSNNCREGRSERLHKKYMWSRVKHKGFSVKWTAYVLRPSGTELGVNVPSTQVHQQANFFTVISYSIDNLSYSGQDSARSYNWQSNCRWSRPY